MEKELSERLDYELGVIGKTGFNDYFLIVADFMNWAREHGIPVGPGRGSGRAASLPMFLESPISIHYALGYSLSVFNPERVPRALISIFVSAAGQKSLNMSEKNTVGIVWPTSSPLVPLGPRW